MIQLFTGTSVHISIEKEITPTQIKQLIDCVRTNFCNKYININLQEDLEDSSEFYFYLSTSKFFENDIKIKTIKDLKNIYDVTIEIHEYNEGELKNITFI